MTYIQRLAIAMLVISSAAIGQTTTTPNIGLEIPADNAEDWSVQLNYNWNTLDSLLSGASALPGLKISGPANLPQLNTWQSSTTYAKGQIVAYLGTFYVSVGNGNVNNLPTNTTYWTAASSYLPLAGGPMSGTITDTTGDYGLYASGGLLTGAYLNFGYQTPEPSYIYAIKVTPPTNTTEPLIFSDYAAAFGGTNAPFAMQGISNNTGTSAPNGCPGAGCNPFMGHYIGAIFNASENAGGLLTGIGAEGRVDVTSTAAGQQHYVGVLGVAAKNFSGNNIQAQHAFEAIAQSCNSSAVTFVTGGPNSDYAGGHESCSSPDAHGVGIGLFVPPIQGFAQKWAAYFEADPLYAGGGVSYPEGYTSNHAPRSYVDINTGSLTSITANQEFKAVLTTVPGTLENITGVASTFTCTGNPVITLFDCGTSAGACSPTALGSITFTAANVTTLGSVTSPTLSSGHWLVAATTSGTCSAFNASLTTSIREN